MDDLPAPDFTFLTSGFRGGLREAIRDVDEYMQDYWAEGTQDQSAITIDPIELAETGVEAEVEAEEVVEEIILL